MKSKFLLAMLCALGITYNTTNAYAIQSANKADKIDIVAASFHEYDWLSQIIKGKEDKFTLTLLLDNGIDMHNFQPSVQDIALITSADFFVHNGGVSDSWLENISESAINPNLVIFNVLEMLGDDVKMETIVEGMQEDHSGHAHHEEHKHEEHEHHEEHAHNHQHDEHEHNEECDHSHNEHAHHEEHAHHDEHEAISAHEDEHVWLSLNYAIEICEMLENAISELDPQNESVYESNTKKYIAKLEILDEEYQDAVAKLPRNTLIFADRFPFLYMMNDYSIDYYAAFQGCSAETEASFETVSFLSKKSNEYNVNYILIIDNGLEELAQTIINTSGNKNTKILTLNSLQSVTAKQINNGATYLSLMEDNLNVLKQALK